MQRQSRALLSVVLNGNSIESFQWGVGGGGKVDRVNRHQKQGPEEKKEVGIKWSKMK